MLKPIAAQRKAGCDIFCVLSRPLYPPVNAVPRPKYSLATATETPSLPIEPPTELDFNFFGKFASSLARDAAAWLYDNGVVGDCLTPLERFLTEARTQHRRDGQDCFAFTVRIERERPDFDIPNPHHDGDDGRYWNVELGREGQEIDAPFKLGMVLLGPGTVFY